MAKIPLDPILLMVSCLQFQAYIRLIDAYYIQGNYRNAKNALNALTDRNPEYLKTNDYKVCSSQEFKVLPLKHLQGLCC